MTLEDLVDWIKQNGCEQKPIEGVNISGCSIKFYNPKTGRHIYIETPIDEREVTEYVIAHTCEQLGIQSPDCVAAQTHIVKKIKERFSPKGK